MVARCMLLVGLFALPAGADDKDKPLAPVEARNG